MSIAVLIKASVQHIKMSTAVLIKHQFNTQLKMSVAVLIKASQLKMSIAVLIKASVQHKTKNEYSCPNESINKSITTKNEYSCPNKSISSTHN